MGRFINKQHMIIAIVGFGIAMSLSPAYAQFQIKKFKEFDADNVTTFIENTTEITTDRSGQLNAKQINTYLKRHIDKKARFKTTITYVMPGMPEQERVLTLSKKDYIEQIKKGAESVDDYYTEVEIESIDISDDRETASVNTISTESGMMQVPNPDGSFESVPIEGESKCFQVLKLSRSGYIQMYSANCVTRMEFQSY